MSNVISGAVATLLKDGTRLHLHHGPIDLIIGADPVVAGGRQKAFGAATKRFETVLDELVAELPLLRCACHPSREVPKGDIARHMDKAVRPHSTHFVTPMAAVAGAVADEVLTAMVAGVNLKRAYVNNGGDIALHLAPNQSFTAAIAGLTGRDLGRTTITADTGVRGIATSGQGGRSLSFGIADSVTVLARTAAVADVAATLIANAVDLPNHPDIRRRAACDIQPDSDLGARLVVTSCGALTTSDIDCALDAGLGEAARMLSRGLIIGAALYLRGVTRLIGGIALKLEQNVKVVEHA